MSHIYGGKPALIGYQRCFNGINDLKQTVCVYHNVSIWSFRVNMILRKLEQAENQYTNAVTSFPLDNVASQLSMLIISYHVSMVTS